jgi:RNA polymerase sigma-70 factor (ECF subfamily)
MVSVALDGNWLQTGCLRDPINFRTPGCVISLTRMLRNPASLAREPSAPVVSPDTDLIARAAAGDHSAFHAIVEKHRSMVYRVAYQFAGNHHDAEDIAQNVFIKVYRSLDRFRQDAQLTSWMYRIVMNACIDYRRRHAPAGAAPFGEEAEQRMLNTPEEAPGPEERAYAGELGEVLEAEIQRLPPGQRMVFIMRHHQGLKLGEIADSLGLAEGTVKRQLHAAVHRLRQALTVANITAGEQA